MLRQLRQTRYLTLGALMVILAAVCCTAGYWQVQRFTEKRHDNTLLRANAHRPSADVATVLRPTGSPGAGHTAHLAQFRTVTATGRYDVSGQVLVREQTVNGDVGYLVLTPLRIDDSPALLVVRGFVAADQNRTPDVKAPPTGSVEITGRVETAGNAPEGAAGAPSGQIRNINANDASHRLNEPVFDGYAELLDGQPGQAGLTVIPDPDLSNPAGGAVEPQHLAYVIQWFLFAALALAAPFVMARVDSRRPGAEIDVAPRRQRFREFDDSAAATDHPEHTDADKRLADRYGTARRV